MSITWEIAAAMACDTKVVARRRSTGGCVALLTGKGRSAQERCVACISDSLKQFVANSGRSKLSSPVQPEAQLFSSDWLSLTIAWIQPFSQKSSSEDNSLTRYTREAVLRGIGNGN